MALTIDDLKPADYNPREISPEAAEALGKSVERFGDISGIVWNKRTGNLVAGHQRVDQLRKAGGQVVGDAVVIGTGDRQRRFPIRVVDWAISEEKAANIAANNPGISGVFTDGLPDLLAEVHAALGDENFATLGFDYLDKTFMAASDLIEPEGEGAGDPTAEQVTCPECGHRFAK